MMGKECIHTVVNGGGISSGSACDICENIDSNITKPRLILHSCCGPCSTSVIERLAPDYNISVFFYNPCITDSEEYELRKKNQIKYINEFNEDNPFNTKIKFIEGSYDPREYFDIASEYASEPEGGKRCTVCFRQRLTGTAKYGKKHDFDMFATTLTVSPHKNYKLISELGNEIAEAEGIEFLDMDFKKKAGFQRSIELSKEHELYRQNYCGCEYSKR